MQQQETQQQTSGLTYGDYLNQIAHEPTRNRAILAAKHASVSGCKLDVECSAKFDSLHMALHNSFVFGFTEEGYEYWKAVHKELERGNNTDIAMSLIEDIYLAK